MPKKGYKQTKKHKQNISKAQIERFKDPKEREKVSEGGKKRYKDPKEREKTSKANIKRYKDPKEREKLSIAQIERFKDPKEREKLSKALKNNPNLINAQIERFKDPKEREKFSKALIEYFKDPKAREKVSKARKKFIGENPHFQDGEKNPMYRKKHSKETRKRMSDAKIKFYKEHPEFQKRENHPNWNPDRTVVYAPYGPNFHNQILRKARWQLQGGRDLIIGNSLNLYTTQAYHHIDWNKSNDNPDNHVWVSRNTHGKLHSKRKRKYYEQILRQNLRDLKNGKIPRTWSEKNKLLYKQDRRTQTTLDDILKI